MRLIITKTEEDLFCQGEWLDAIGTHTRRITEDMPPEIRTAVESVMDWANAEETATYAPMTEKDGEIQRLDQEIGRLQGHLKQLKG